MSAGLNEKQAEMLQEIEQLLGQALRYAAQFGFAWGVHAGFHLLLTEHDPRGLFEHLVARELLHPTSQLYAEWQAKSVTLTQALQDELGNILREHMIAVECRWDECIYGMLRHSFYLERRYAVHLVYGSAPTLIVNEKLRQIEQAIGFPHNP